MSATASSLTANSMWSCAEVVGDTAGGAALVEGRLVREPDAEGVDRLGARARSSAPTTMRGVDAAREQRAERHVGDHPPRVAARSERADARDAASAGARTSACAGSGSQYSRGPVSPSASNATTAAGGTCRMPLVERVAGSGRSRRSGTRAAGPIVHAAGTHGQRSSDLISEAKAMRSAAIGVEQRLLARPGRGRAGAGRRGRPRARARTSRRAARRTSLAPRLVGAQHDLRVAASTGSGTRGPRARGAARGSCRPRRCRPARLNRPRLPSAGGPRR